MTAAAPSRKEAMKAAVDAIVDVAEDLVHGRIDIEALEAVAAERACQRCRTVAGPGDSHWPVQLDICRRVLAAGGIATNELAEWTAVGRQRDRDADCAPLIEPLGDERGYMGVVTPVGLSDAAETISGASVAVDGVDMGQPQHGIRPEGPDLGVAEL